MKIKTSIITELNMLINQHEKNLYFLCDFDKIVFVSYQEMIDICHTAYMYGKYHGDFGMVDFHIVQKNPRLIFEHSEKVWALDDAMRRGVESYEISFRGYELKVK